MSMDSIPRQPAGSPQGGQFASTGHAEADLGLDQQKDWGQAKAAVGGRSPWGEVDYVEDIAPGIAFVSTSSHGGYRLSPQRNREVPPALRVSNGWYEEDCERYIVEWTYPDETGVTRESSDPGLREWYPHQYEQATGQKVKPEESSQLRHELFMAAHEGDWKLQGASTEDDGRIRAWVKRGDDKRQVLMDKSDFDAASRESYNRAFPTIDRFEDVTPPPAPEPVRFKEAALAENLTPAQRSRAEKDLNRLWATDNGPKSLRSIISEDGMDERRRYVDDRGRVEYALIRDNSSYRVSAATWKGLSGIPGDDTPVKDAEIAYRRASAALEKARRDTRGMRNFAEAGRIVRGAEASSDKAYSQWKHLRDDGPALPDL